MRAVFELATPSYDPCRSSGRRSASRLAASRRASVRPSLGVSVRALHFNHVMDVISWDTPCGLRDVLRISENISLTGSGFSTNSWQSIRSPSSPNESARTPSITMDRPTVVVVVMEVVEDEVVDVIVVLDVVVEVAVVEVTVDVDVVRVVEVADVVVVVELDELELDELVVLVELDDVVLEVVVEEVVVLVVVVVLVHTGAKPCMKASAA